MWCCFHTQRLTKGFFLFQFFDKAHVHDVITYGPWVCNNTLVVFSPRDEGFSIDWTTRLSCLVQGEFHGLSLSTFLYLSMDLFAMSTCYILSLSHKGGCVLESTGQIITKQLFLFPKLES
jgi:hypothetical protein